MTKEFFENVLFPWIRIAVQSLVIAALVYTIFMMAGLAKL